MNDESREIVPATPEMDLVAPVDAKYILEVFRKFEWLKRNVIGPEDTQKIGNTSFTKKSGCLKFALSCNVSLEKREERVEKDDDEIVFHYTFRAIAPSGRFVDADGSASSTERAFVHLPHDVRALAQTRACNRAILNLVGGGEVSFEEMDSAPASTKSKKAKPTPTKKLKNLSPEQAASLKEVSLKKPWTWDKMFKKYGPEIQTRQEQLGKLWSYESAAVVFAREKGLVKKEQELPL